MHKYHDFDLCVVYKTSDIYALILDNDEIKSDVYHLKIDRAEHRSHERNGKRNIRFIRSRSHD